jgi:hypothetical protein
MRGHHDTGSHVKPASVQQRDAAAVGVADQHRVFDIQRAQQLGQYRPRFFVHVIRAQAACTTHVRHRIRLPITAPGIHPTRASRRRAKLLRPVAPHGCRAEAFVQKDQWGHPALFVRRGDVLNLQANTANFNPWHRAMLRHVLIETGSSPGGELAGTGTLPGSLQSGFQ